MSKIWSKAKIRSIEFGNRIVRSATNEFLGTGNGEVTNGHLEVYSDLAKSGVGLIITSHMAIDKSQRGHLTHICVNEPQNFEKLKQLTSVVHENNSKIIAQISYGGHYASLIDGQVAKSPSSTKKSKEITNKEIDEFIQGYITTTKRVQEAGFDGVQLHAAHGYFLSEFLDPFYNKRTDEYGGSVDNRYRIIHKILTGIKEIVDPKFLVIIKIDSNSVDDAPGFLEDQIKICKLLEQDAVDAIEVSGHGKFKHKGDNPLFLENTLKIKREITIPVIAVGGFRTVEQIQNALDKGVDFVAMARPFIADANLIQRLKDSGKSNCIDCGKCFEIYKTHHKRCALQIGR